MRWPILAWGILGSLAVIVSAESGRLDLSQYAQLLSSHLVREHVDIAFYTMSKQVSTQFREAVEVLGDEQLEPVSPIDVQILKRQLRGAVGSYIEDRLPAAWNRHDASALSLASLSAFIENRVLEFCAPVMEDNDSTSSTSSNTMNPRDGFNSSDDRTIPIECLQEPRDRQLLSAIDRYINTHIQRTVSDLARDEFPSLLDTAQHQVTDVITHFRRMTGCQLVLQVNRNQAVALNTLVDSWEQPTEDALLHAIRQIAHSACIVDD